MSDRGEQDARAVKEALSARFESFVVNPYAEADTWDPFLLHQFAAYIALENCRATSPDIDLDNLSSKAVIRLMEETATEAIGLATWNQRKACDYIEADTLVRDEDYYLSHLSKWLRSKNFPVIQGSTNG